MTWCNYFFKSSPWLCQLLVLFYSSSYQITFLFERTWRLKVKWLGQSQTLWRSRVSDSAVCGSKTCALCTTLLLSGFFHPSTLQGTKEQTYYPRSLGTWLKQTSTNIQFPWSLNVLSLEMIQILYPLYSIVYSTCYFNTKLFSLVEHWANN